MQISVDTVTDELLFNEYMVKKYLLNFNTFKDFEPDNLLPQVLKSAADMLVKPVFTIFRK